MSSTLPSVLASPATVSHLHVGTLYDRAERAVCDRDHIRSVMTVTAHFVELWSCAAEYLCARKTQLVLETGVVDFSESMGLDLGVAEEGCNRETVQLPIVNREI